MSSKRVLKDLDAIQIYDETLELILPNSGETWARIIGYLRLELVKAMPKDADASRACFRACLAKEDYEHARQIANSLEKNFPSSHEYVFWNIATMFLYSVSYINHSFRIDDPLLVYPSCWAADALVFFSVV